jgi:hypothetical protein
MRKTVALAAVLAASHGMGCKDIGSFTTAPGESYCGELVPAEFILVGFKPPIKMRIKFDADHLSDTPGNLSTDDHVFNYAPMRPITPLFSDALFTLQFGEGRDKNLLYMVDPDDASNGPTVNVVLSLMHSGELEVRLIRGAPASIDGGPPPNPEDGAPRFGVFGPLRRETGECSF